MLEVLFHCLQHVLLKRQDLFAPKCVTRFSGIVQGFLRRGPKLVQVVQNLQADVALAGGHAGQFTISQQRGGNFPPRIKTVLAV